MSDPKRNSDSTDDQVQFSSDNCDILEVREKDTKPGKVSANYRKWLKEKWGRKSLPPNGSAGEPKAS